MDKEELLKKLKVLSERGIGGEKNNAEKLLKKLMLKYGINEQDINDEKIDTFSIKIPRFYNATKLASQVFYSIVGTTSGKGMYKHNGQVFLKCTNADFLEFEAKFNFYKYHYKKELNRFFRAFIQANYIFPNDGKSSTDISEEDLKMLKLASKLEKHNFSLQIEQK